MKQMKTSLKGMVEIASHEGCCLTKYKDSVGVWTIGIGATRSEIPDIASWPMDKELSVKECFDLFKKSLEKYERAINQNLTREIPQHMFDALVSWCYNVGTGWVSKATVMRRINNYETGKRLHDALMMYKKPPEIVGRRRKEADLLAYGYYTENPRVNVFPVSKSGHPIYSRGTSVDPTPYLVEEEKVEETPIVVENTQSDTFWTNILVKIFKYFLTK